MAAASARAWRQQQHVQAQRQQLLSTVIFILFYFVFNVLVEPQFLCT
jgi:uncharacterized membrane protein (DUF485 family)